jgi:zinc transporter ZupT
VNLKEMIFFVFAVLFLFFGEMISDPVVFVATAGVDSGDCTIISSPCQTLDYALSVTSGSMISVVVKDAADFPV